MIILERKNVDDKVRVALIVGHYCRFGESEKTKGFLNGIYEYDVCYQVVDYCNRYLQNSNYIYPVLISSNPIIYKIDDINDGNFDIAVEVHLNHNKDKKYTGVETCFNEPASQLGTIMQGQLVIDLKDMDRGVFDNDKESILKYLNIPTVIPKIGFLSNDIFMNKCKNNEVQEIAGKSIADSLNFYIHNFNIGGDK
jgi:N-acetylmuramoyl-L-alanine amidase